MQFVWTSGPGLMEMKCAPSHFGLKPNGYGMEAEMPPFITLSSDLS
jgi:hypothetical protein